MEKSAIFLFDGDLRFKSSLPYTYRGDVQKAEVVKELQWENSGILRNLNYFAYFLINSEICENRLSIENSRNLRNPTLALKSSKTCTSLLFDHHMDNENLIPIYLIPI